MVALRIYTVDGEVELFAEGVALCTRAGVVLEGSIPANLELWPGEGVFVDPGPISTARALEGVHAGLAVTVGDRLLRLEGARVALEGVLLVIRSTMTIDWE